MRVLQVSHAFPPTFGGVETHLWDITHGLTRHGHEVFCLVGGAEGSATHVVPGHGPITVTRAPEISVGHLVAARAGLGPTVPNQHLRGRLQEVVSHAISAYRPDLLHLHNAHHFAPELAQAVLDCADSGPVLNSVHDRVGEHIYEDVLDYPWACVIYASRYLAETLPSARPSISLHLGIDLGLFQADGPREPRFADLEHPIIFHPARLLRWKGILVGLDAFAALRRRMGRGTLVLCDSTLTVDDPTELHAFRAEVETAANRAEIADNIQFFRFGREQMPAAYRACSLVWYPTIEDEPLGLVPLEAMACGVPIIVSRSGGMTETVAHGRTGLVVPKGDAAALASAAYHILADGPASAVLRARLVRQARQESTRFSGDAYVESLDRIYAETVPASWWHEREGGQR